jgi:hypothetical protein
MKVRLTYAVVLDSLAFTGALFRSIVFGFSRNDSVLGLHTADAFAEGLLSGIRCRD